MNSSSTLSNTLNFWRVIAFGVVIVIVIIIYTARLFNVQIVQGAEWSLQAEDNRTTTINLPAARGIIYDRNGIVLARNIAMYNIVITPAELPEDEGEKQEIYRKLSPLIDLPVNQGELSEDNPYVPCLSNQGITQIVLYGSTTAPFQPVKIKCDVDESVAKIVREKSVDWPGVSVEVEPLRDYPTGSLTATIVGYLGPISEHNEAYYRSLGFDPNRDKIGFAGVERTYQTTLAGQNGLRTVERDAAGKIIRDIEPPIPAIPGNNIRLTIDSRLQQAVEAILTSEIDGWNAWLRENRMTSGAAIVMNPQTGEILAMVSYPTYENNRLARFIPAYYYQQLVSDKRVPLLNHAVGDVLPVGSIFKIVTAVGALNEGVIDTSTIIDAPGILTICERFSPNAPCTPKPFYDHNWQAGGFGQIDFVHAIAQSSNVYFYKVGGGYEDEVQQGLGICRIGTYARALGYGEYTQIRLPSEDEIIEGGSLNFVLPEETPLLLPEEAPSLVPDPEYKRLQGESWTLGDTYLVSVGQGYMLSTPLQALLSASTIAADGKLMTPAILYEIVDGEGNVTRPFEPRMRWDITVDPVIKEYEAGYGIRGCQDAETGNYKTVDPYVIEKVQEGMRLAVTEGTLADDARGFQDLNIAVAGKTGTAEYCDEYSIEARGGMMCERGDWDRHAWTLAYAPYDNPEIAVVAFVYNGGEGSSTAGPIVSRIVRAYFGLKAIDNVLVSP